MPRVPILALREHSLPPQLILSSSPIDGEFDPSPQMTRAVGTAYAPSPVPWAAASVAPLLSALLARGLHTPGRETQDAR